MRFHILSLTLSKPDDEGGRLRLDCRSPRAVVLLAILAKFHARCSDLSCLLEPTANRYPYLSMFDFFCDMSVKAKTGKTLTFDDLMTAQAITIDLDYNRVMVSALQQQGNISAPFITSQPYK